MVRMAETEAATAVPAAGCRVRLPTHGQSVPEARAAVLAVRSVSSKPVFVSFSCDEQGKTLSGTDITAAALVMQGMGISAFGMNCSAGPVQMLPHLQRLAKRMMRTIRLNMTFSMALNFAAIVLAMTGALDPVVGALVHNAGSVLVIVNSAFLLKWRSRD